MESITGRYMQEIVSLTIMMLMAVALIAGQAGATVHDTVRTDTGYEATTLAAGVEAVLESTLIRADITLQVNLDDIAELGAELGVDASASEAIREFMKLRLHVED